MIVISMDGFEDIRQTLAPATQTHVVDIIEQSKQLTLCLCELVPLHQIFAIKLQNDLYITFLLDNNEKILYMVFTKHYPG